MIPRVHVKSAKDAIASGIGDKAETRSKDAHEVHVVKITLATEETVESSDDLSDPDPQEEPRTPTMLARPVKKLQTIRLLISMGPTLTVYPVVVATFGYRLGVRWLR